MGKKVSEVQSVLEVIVEKIQKLENLRAGRQEEEL
jgi:hypothetical protein